MGTSFTTRRRAALVIGTVLAAGAACTGTTTEPARPLAGCYRLQTNIAAGTLAEVDALPDSVRLLGARGVASLETGRALVRAHPDSLRTSYAWAWWEVAAPDTLTLVFTTGFSGARLALRPSGSRFVGSVEVFNDALPVPPPGSRAWLEPIACAA